MKRDYKLFLKDIILAYFGIDYKLVWDAIKLEIPELIHKLQEILAELEKGG